MGRAVSPCSSAAAGASFEAVGLGVVCAIQSSPAASDAGVPLDDPEPPYRLGPVTLPEEAEGAKQAPTAEIKMFVELEKVLQAAAEHRSARWLCLFGSWCQVMGAVRYQHLQRSILLKVTSQTCYFVCTRGKQKHSRDGFGIALVVRSGFSATDQVAFGNWLGREKAGAQSVLYQRGSVPRLA